MQNLLIKKSPRAKPRRKIGGDKVQNNKQTTELEKKTLFMQEIQDYYGQDTLEKLKKILKILEGCTVLEARTVLLIVEEVIDRYKIEQLKTKK